MRCAPKNPNKTNQNQTKTKNTTQKARAARALRARAPPSTQFGFTLIVFEVPPAPKRKMDLQNRVRDAFRLCFFCAQGPLKNDSLHSGASFLKYCDYFRLRSFSDSRGHALHTPLARAPCPKKPNVHFRSRLLVAFFEFLSFVFLFSFFRGFLENERRVAPPKIAKVP
jgi:hypothetical protein